MAAMLCCLPGRAATLNHFQPQSGNESYLVSSAPGVLSHLESNVWLMGTYASNPLVYRDASGKIIRKAVSDQLHLELGSSFGLADIMQLGIALPFGYVGGEGVDGRGLSTMSLADARIMAKLRLTPWKEGFIAGLRSVATLPFSQASTTGSALVGEQLPTFTAAASAGFQDGSLRLGFDVGAVLRNPTPLGSSRAAEFVAQQIGHEIIWGMGAEVPLRGDLSVLTDLYGRFTPTSLNSSVPQMPTEIAIALRGWVNDVQLTAGVGSGVVAGFGTPSGRVFLNATFLAKRPTQPRFYEQAAAALETIGASMGLPPLPQFSEVSSSSQKIETVAVPKGKPPGDQAKGATVDARSESSTPTSADEESSNEDDFSSTELYTEEDEDNDADAGLEAERAALVAQCAALDEGAQKATPDTPRPGANGPNSNGIQVCAGPNAQHLPQCQTYQPDRDRDGIPDAVDRCRSHPEDHDGWQDSDGCPDWDNDGDHILDTLDECPNDPENVDGHLDDDGCPDVQGRQDVVIQFRKDHISYQPQRLFPSGRSTLSPTAELVLERLAQKLESHKEVTSVRIIGLPDNIRNTPSNRQLAGKRAAETHDFLVAKGIASDRLVTSNALEENEAFLQGRELGRVQLLFQIEGETAPHTKAAR